MITRRLLALLVAALALVACEDDPILEPTQKADQPSGSYGKISLPELSRDSLVRDVPSRTNPELY